MKFCRERKIESPINYIAVCNFVKRCDEFIVGFADKKKIKEFIARVIFLKNVIQKFSTREKTHTYRNKILEKNSNKIKHCQQHKLSTTQSPL